MAADAATSDVQCRKASTRDSATANARIIAMTRSVFDSALKISTPARANAPTVCPLGNELAEARA